MQICAVHTNIKDNELKLNYYIHLTHIIDYLVVFQNVQLFIINRNNAFDRLCEEVIENNKDIRLSRIRIANSSKISPFEKLLDIQAMQTSGIPRNYLICDETTKSDIRKKFCVDHFIEIPDSNIYIASCDPLW